jgi:hypothetical protein|mmetsp:Transcript_1091/g.3580  ORF Transcript_1091/g.3580 Transcript_1091/m.3580 type:complete len:279 (+) Transcript_1091:4306-5142(+)
MNFRGSDPNATATSPVGPVGKPVGTGSRPSSFLICFGNAVSERTVSSLAVLALHVVVHLRPRSGVFRDVDTGTPFETNARRPPEPRASQTRTCVTTTRGASAEPCMRIAPVAGRGRARNECDVGVSSRDLCIRSTTMSSFFFEKRSETENDEKGHYPLLVDHSLTTKRPTSPCSTCSETCSAVPVTKAASKLQPPRLVRDPEWWKLRGRGTRPSLGHQIAQVAEFRFFHCPTFANREPHNANALTHPHTLPTNTQASARGQTAAAASGASAAPRASAG